MIEWVLSSSILIVVIIALRYLLKGRISLRLQYALWGLVLLRLLIPFHIGSSSFSVVNALPDRVPETVLSDGVYTAPESAVPDTPSAVRGESEPNIVYSSDSVTDGSGTVTDRGGIVKAVWLAGIAVVGLWLLISNLRLAGKLKKSRQTLACAHCKLPVYLSDAVDTPCLFGLFRPSIYVTGEAAESETRLRHIVAHEMTHRRHGDNYWALLRGVCLALHWYNPLVWWAAVLSRNDAELACDEATIKRIGENERAEYGRTLIAMTCQKRPALLNTATTMTGGKNSIKERITLMVKKPKTALCTLIAVVLIAAVAVGCTFTGAKDSENTAGAADTPYGSGELTAAIPEGTIQQEQPDAKEQSLPEGLPTALASIEDLDGSGGYLLLGEIPEADIALYCDNSEERNRAYIRYGEHFQAFDQKAWIDPTVLPELSWTDWDEDGSMDLVIQYLRHEGTYFNGETSSPALVCEEVVYQWDGEQWTDIHFYVGEAIHTNEQNNADSSASDNAKPSAQNEGVTITQAFMTEDDGENFVIENPAELRSFLSSLDYHSYPCDGLPEYDISFDDGTTYHINLSSRWVWQGNEKEADLSEDLLAELQALLGIELCAYPISVIQ